jgi:hypothetical protein
MAVLLRIVLVILSAIATALLVPRVAGEEYHVDLRWAFALDPDSAFQWHPSMPAANDLVAAGNDIVVVLDRDSGALIGSGARHTAFSTSNELFLNQPLETGGRWVLSDRVSGELHYLDARGIPLLFGPILAQFGSDRIVLYHPRFTREVVLPHEGTLTAFDLISVMTEEIGEYALVVTGDVFGTLLVRRVYFGGASVDEPLMINTGSLVHGLAIIPDGDPVILVVRGVDPQFVEIYRGHEDDGDTPVVRYEVPAENAVRSPPVIRRVDRESYAVSLDHLLLVVNFRLGSVIPVPRSDPRPVAGFMPARTSGVVYATVSDEGVQLVVAEALRGGAASVEWRMPGTVIAALEPDVLVVERDNQFFALQVER